MIALSFFPMDRISSDDTIKINDGASKGVKGKLVRGE